MRRTEDADGAALLQLAVGSTPDEVRAALAEIRIRLRNAGCCAATRDKIELVMAEAMNNVVEHAYGDAPGGTIRLAMWCRNGRFRGELRDRGRAMPGAAPPDPAAPDPDVPRSDLPEGGFGWFLIRSLTDSLEYRRKDGENLTVLELSVEC